MNLRNIEKLNKRQFDLTMKREGQTITDFYTGEIIPVFFRTMKHSDSSNLKVRIYYDYNANIHRGTLFRYGGDIFLVVNQNGIESNVFYTSVAVRCSQNIPCDGETIPFVVSEIKNVMPIIGNITSRINGAISVYTGDTQAVRSIGIDDAFVIFGGTYKVVNTFYNDGLAYIFFARELTEETYSLGYEGLYQLDLADISTYQLDFRAYQGSATVPDAELTYESSDTAVATVSASGLLTLLDLIDALGHDEHHLYRILADILDHLVEHIEALKTVLDNGVVLTV